MGKMSREKFRKHMDELDRMYDEYLEYADELCNERNKQDRLEDEARRNGEDLDGLV